MLKQSLNYIWIPIAYADVSPPIHVGCPIPEDYIENISRIADENYNADVFLWVDKKRFSEREYECLLAKIKQSEGIKRIQVKDLMDIPGYQTDFFANGETSLSWRYNKHSTIWCQVDAAKFLVCLQGEYDQSFVADMDVADIDINSYEIQSRIKKHGMYIGLLGYSRAQISFENHFFGFSTDKKHLVREALSRSLANGQINGYEHMRAIMQPLFEAGLKLEEIGTVSRFINLMAHHPTRTNPYGNQQTPSWAFPEI